jgi:tetratricopeptide (TPR) repeat protein
MDRAHLKEVFAAHKKPGVNPADYDVLEEVFYGAIRAGDLDLAEQVRDVIFERFPAKEFPRSGRIQIMLDESRGQYESAGRGNKALLHVSEDADVATRKRQVVLALAQGQKAEAIELLTKYVDTFAADLEAWNQLCSLYLDEQMYAQAQFCAEEAILLDPHFHHGHIRLAEVYCTRGDATLAVKHYARALNLCPDTIRALYGLKMATAKLLGEAGPVAAGTPSKKGTEVVVGGEEREKWTALHKIAVDRLTVLYAGKSGPSVETAKKWLAGK